MLREFMPSVIDYSVGEGVEICVADNASSDESLEMLRTEFPVVRLIELDQNYGFAEGYNRALTQVDAEYVVLLNSDVEVTPHWLEPLLDYMDTHSGIAACQPKLLSWHNKEYFEYAGASGGFIDRYGYPFCRGRIFDVLEKDCGQYDTVTEVMWATGAALFIRLADYREAGGLDSRFFCSHGRNRSVLAFAQSGEKTCLHSAKCGISCRRGYVEKRESEKDLSEFQKQPVDAL